MGLFDYFERAFIINLPERRDRRRDMQRQLQKAGLAGNQRIEFFDGIRAATLAGWPNCGARGSFLSHYTILRRARDRGFETVAVLEDDCSFTPAFARFEERIEQELASRVWGIVHLGHIEPSQLLEAAELRTWTRTVRTAHFYAVHRSVLERLVDFLEKLMARAPGHPLGGPQYYDGALSTFRAQNPDVVTLLPFPSLARQRSSSSDLDTRWFDRVPAIRATANGLRRFWEHLRAAQEREP